MFIGLTDLENKNIICNGDQVECVFVDKIDRKGNTATVVKLQSGTFFCVQENVLEVATRLNSPMFLNLLDYEFKEIVFNINQIETVLIGRTRTTKGQTIVLCKSGRSYLIGERLVDVYRALCPIT